MNTMLAARLHKVGEPMQLERLPIPKPRPTDVVVQVKACGIVPNLGNILANWQNWFPELPLPNLPAIFGLDVAGIVSEVGELVQHFKPGDRVYVNPGLSCGSCRACRAENALNCINYTFRGYFGFGPQSQKQFDAYPYAGLAEYSCSPQENLVRIPDSVTFEQAARFGYLGTAYAALRKANAGPETSVLIDGISGTLGLGAALIALGRGVPRIYGTGRNRDLLQEVKALAPSRIEVLSLGDRPASEWAREKNGGGVDVTICCLGPGAPGSAMVDSIYALKRGGIAINIGGVGEKTTMDIHWMMDEQISFIGSNWFSPGEGQALADMAAAGTLDLSVFEHRRFPLADINGALAAIPDRNGGFTNFVVVP
ncbi:MAG: alcohol dehydrogenase catalytic domain-containing protein [Xanthobacteraceae bacterium]